MSHKVLNFRAQPRAIEAAFLANFLVGSYPLWNCSKSEAGSLSPIEIYHLACRTHFGHYAKRQLFQSRQHHVAHEQRCPHRNFRVCLRRRQFWRLASPIMPATIADPTQRRTLVDDGSPNQSYFKKHKVLPRPQDESRPLEVSRRRPPKKELSITTSPSVRTDSQPLQPSNAEASAKTNWYLARPSSYPPLTIPGHRLAHSLPSPQAQLSPLKLSTPIILL